MRSALCVAVLAAISLAGCSDAGSDPAGGTGGATSGNALGGNAATHILAPTWQLGQWWTLSSQQAEADFSHVVSGEEGADWILDTDSPDIAFFNARFDISFLGPVRKSDLAGSQGGSRVEFLRFPLHANLNWSTTWDELPMRIQVMSVEDGEGRLMATHENGTMYAHYTYSARHAYFTVFTFFEADGSTVSFEWTLKEAGKAFADPIVRWDIEQVLDKGGQLPPADSGTFPVDAQATDVYAEVALDCTVGFATVAVGIATGANTGAGYGLPGTPCPTRQQFSGPLAPHTEGNTWAYAIQSTGVAGAAPAGTFSLQAWQRTLTTFSVGDAP